ncbi:hypothetical protein FKW77_010312 [Venturia effusa]|uniref:Major facilitator superfamily (MFS) profile domain-containing protein n=1 Tax=Venturia effusa TaxID=50376 RepID=A0A517L4D2_9PEZI|nr:hypothetical protein FKW77_010312 [Venturia effusa]
MAPTRKRGTYVSALIFTIIPFCPSVLWSQLIAYYSTWRYCGLVCGIWAAIGTLLVAFFYFPPPRINSTGMSNKEILGQIDWLGGLLSIAGMVLFVAALQWGGYMAFNVYGHDPIGVGLRGLPVAFAIMFGACIVLILLSITRGKIRILMLGSTITMTAGLGIGGILVPASIITTIVCPDDLIATVSALTLAVRVVGGSIGYAIYFNVFFNKVVPILGEKVSTTMIQAGLDNPADIGAVIKLTGESLIEEIGRIPAVREKGPVVLQNIILAGQIAYSDAYKYIYFVSIAFGVISIVAAGFLGDIDKFMDDHVAVVIH